MTRKFLQRSLALWRRRHAWRQRRLDVAHQRNDAKAIKKWERLRREAGAVIDRRKTQLRATEPLHERAWQVMESLIDEKVSEDGRNNRGKKVDEIIRANGGTPGEAWCGDTNAYCYLKAGSKSVTRAWAAVRLLLAGKATKHPVRGDIVRYRFDHTGLFERWAPEIAPDAFYAGEGNTGDSGAVSDSKTGRDGVKRKLRRLDQVRDFRHLTR